MMEDTQHNSAACSQFSSELEAYLEGEARPFVASHREQCSPCAALLADLQFIRVAAQNLPQQDPSPELWGKLRVKLQAEGARAVPACAQFEAELPAYLEGEARPFIASHAHDCAPCGALLADLQAIQIAARDLPQEEPSPAVWANLHVQLQAEGAFAVPACAQFEAELAAYLEGESRPFIASHAHDCAPCATLLADLQSIQQAAKSLPQEEPSPVVWANVRARLEAEGAFGVPVSGWRQILSWRLFPQPVPLGARAALAVLAAVLTMPSRNLQSWSDLNGVGNSSAVAQLASAAPLGEDKALVHVVSDLESSFRANEASMTPDLKATYEKSLVSLDGSIKECLDSLQHEPSNTLAHDYLLTAYTRKAEVLSSALEFEGR
jgi:hypothetical protein